MCFFDGELDAERHAEVERFLAASPAAGSKLRGLGVAGEMLRIRSAEGAAADGIASAVLASIAAEAAPVATVHAISAARPARGASATNIHEHRSLRVLWFAAAAVAAAAALFAFGRGGLFQSDSHVARRSPTAEPSNAALPSTTPTVEPGGAAPQDSAIAAADDEAEPVHGVEVAAVEFGPKMGSIFYVPSGDAPTGMTTTVVWLADDAAPEE
jgi:hypothetical protein